MDKLVEVIQAGIKKYKGMKSDEMASALAQDLYRDNIVQKPEQSTFATKNKMAANEQPGPNSQPSVSDQGANNSDTNKATFAVDQARYAEEVGKIKSILSKDDGSLYTPEDIQNMNEDERNAILKEFYGDKKVEGSSTQLLLNLLSRVKK